ncbi:MAG: hypothetical protein HY718_13940 [Planctomycetes bacterium]|nr:hypothetical protein [Planctomycetota bacterium]
MPTASCACGARYNVKASAHGQRARCKKCGQSFTVHVAEPSESEFSLAALREIEHGDALPADRSPRTTVPNSAPTPAIVPAAGSAGQDEVGERPPGSLLGFFSALPGVFLVLARPRSLFRFIVAWAVLTVGTVGSGYLLATGRLRLTVLGLVVLAVCEGVFAAFSLNVVRQAAEGDKELPPLPLTEGIEDWWQSFGVPLCAFVGTCLLALAPALLYCIGVAWIGSAAGVGSSGHLLPIAVLAMLGLCLWPMMVLILVMGDAKSLARVDRMVVTAIRTAIPYGCTVLLVYGAAAVLVFAASVLAEDTSFDPLILAVALALRAFAQVVAMRAIGVYCHAFSHKFDWL